MWGLRLRIKSLEKALKRHDSLLFVQETRIGRFDVYRKSQFLCNPAHFLFSLTDDWQPQGVPVEYGADVVINRIKAHDLWRDDSFVENYIKSCEVSEESRSRARRNSIEAFLYEFREKFHKTTSDINTANLKKLYRKENSNGYCEPRL